MTTEGARSGYGMRSFMAGLPDVEVVRDEPDVAVVFVRGELDRTGVPLLAGCLREVLNRGGSGGSGHASGPSVRSWYFVGRKSSHAAALEPRVFRIAAAAGKRA